MACSIPSCPCPMARSGAGLTASLKACEPSSWRNFPNVVDCSALAFFFLAVFTMVKTAKKKNASALQSTTFGKLRQLEGSHAFILAVNPAPLLAMGQGQLGMLQAMNPKGLEALRKVQVVTLTGDWDQQPKVEATLHLDGEEARNDLAGLIDFGHSMAKAQSGQMPQFISGIVSGLEAKTDSDGVKIGFELPKEWADGVLDKLDAAVAQLPSDPKERQKALGTAIQGMVMQGMKGGVAPGAGPGAGRQTRPALPTYTPATGVAPGSTQIGR